MHQGRPPSETGETPSVVVVGALPVRGCAVARFAARRAAGYGSARRRVAASGPFARSHVLARLRYGHALATCATIGGGRRRNRSCPLRAERSMSSSALDESSNVPAGRRHRHVHGTANARTVLPVFRRQRHRSRHQAQLAGEIAAPLMSSHAEWARFGLARVLQLETGNLAVVDVCRAAWTRQSTSRPRTTPGNQPMRWPPPIVSVRAKLASAPLPIGRLRQPSSSPAFVCCPYDRLIGPMDRFAFRENRAPRRPEMSLRRGLRAIGPKAGGVGCGRHGEARTGRFSWRPLGGLSAIAPPSGDCRLRARLLGC